MNIFDIFESQSIEAISWKPSRRSDDYETIWVDVAKLDASWKHDNGLYVGQSGAGGINGRYARFGQWLSQGEPVETPDVSLGYNGEITFGNGRHRFAWFRDHGVKSLPVTVPDEQADEIKKRFGNHLTESILNEYGMSDLATVKDALNNVDQAICYVLPESAIVVLKFELDGLPCKIRLKSRPDNKGKDALQTFRSRVYAASMVMSGGNKPKTWDDVVQALEGRIRQRAIKILTNPHNWKIVGVDYDGFSF